MQCTSLSSQPSLPCFVVQADQPELRKEYTKLFTAASKAKHLFSTSELTELDVYGLWAVLRPQARISESKLDFDCTKQRIVRCY